MHIDDSRQGQPSARPSGAQSLSLTLRLLGEFGVAIGDVRVPAESFGRRKARALLKLLALQPGHRLHRDQVIEWLWPELDIQAASAQLYKAVHHVRRAFDGSALGGKDLLQFKDGVLWLESPERVRTDVDEFERLAEQASHGEEPVALRRAVAIYEGDLLPGDLYEEWTLGARDRLRARFLDLLTALAAGRLSDGHVTEAADAFRRVVELDATREAAHRGLMKAYALQGSADRAAHQYRICGRVLEQELGVAPSQHTVALLDRIENGDFRRVKPDPDVPSSSPKPTFPLIGREKQLATIGALMESLTQKRGGAVAIEGDAGLGKTRLVAEALQLAHSRDWQTLYGGCEQHEGRIPYGPFVEALRAALRNDDTGAHLIPAELAAGIPEIGGSERIPSSDAVAARTALFAGVLRFLAVRAEEDPLVVVLEDLHGADDGTLKLFHYLARNIADLPLLLVVTLRAGEPGAPAAMDELLAELMERGLLHRLTLEPLSSVEHEALLSQCLPGGDIEPEVSEELFRLCEGNSLFTTEVVKQLVGSAILRRTEDRWAFAHDHRPARPLDHVPMSLRSLLRARLALLSVQSRKVLDLAAVAGQNVAFDVLQLGSIKRLDISPHQFFNLVDEALSVGLLEESGLGYRFAHTLFREGVRAQMSIGRRRSLHGHVARIFEELYEGDQRPVEALAHHYAEAGETENAAACLVDAGDAAEAVYDHDDALRRYGDAVDLLAGEDHLAAAATGDLRERIGDVHRAIGQIDEAFGSYTAALKLLDDSEKTPSRRADLHRKIALTSMLVPDMATAETHLALAREARGSQPWESARDLILQALYHWHMNELEEAVLQAHRALSIAEQHNAAPEISQSCEMLALAHFPLGNWEEGLRYELRRASNEWSPDIVVAVDAHLCLWDARVHGDEPREKAQHFIADVAEQAGAHGNLRCLAVCHYALGMIELLEGRFDTADDHLKRSLELHEEIGSTAGMAYVLARRISLMSARGEVSDGGSLIERGLEVAQSTAVGQHALMLVLAAAIRNRLDAEDRPATQGLTAEAEHLAGTARPCPVCSAEMLPAIAATHVEQGNLDEAWEYAQRAEEIAGMGNNVIGAARARDIQGRIHHLRGSIDEAKHSFSEAADVFRSFGQQHELVRTLLAWSELPDAGEALSEAEELLAGKVSGRPPS